MTLGPLCNRRPPPRLPEAPLEAGSGVSVSSLHGGRSRGLRGRGGSARTLPPCPCFPVDALGSGALGSSPVGQRIRPWGPRSTSHVGTTGSWRRCLSGTPMAPGLPCQHRGPEHPGGPEHPVGPSGAFPVALPAVDVPHQACALLVCPARVSCCCPVVPGWVLAPWGPCSACVLTLRTTRCAARVP